MSRGGGMVKMAKYEKYSEKKRKRLKNISDCRMIVTKVSCSGGGNPVNLERIFAGCFSGLTRERLKEYLDFGVEKGYLIEGDGFYSVSKKDDFLLEFQD